MAPRSTANFLSYDLRPAKQSERRIIIESLKIAGDIGLPISTYRYVGMGANRFYDFMLIHKYIGICNMVSLEHDKTMFKRAEFNNPYAFITVKHSTARDFINGDLSELPSALWLDYDGGIGQRIITDVSDIGLKLRLGDFCFVTAFGGPPKVLEGMNEIDRLAWLQDNLGPVSGAISVADCEESAFSNAVHKMLVAAFRNAFAMRRDGRFFPFLQVGYADSVPMVTVGGAFLADGQTAAFRARLRSALPFLSPAPNKLYDIRSFHLTERERVLFDRATTASKKTTSEYKQIKKLGFKDSDISAYKELLRFIPRYVETIV